MAINSPKSNYYLVFYDVNKVHGARPLFRVSQVEYVLLVAAIRSIISLDLKREPKKRNVLFTGIIGLVWRINALLGGK